MLNLSQRQSLQQKLSPQQIQYIKLLQLPTLALEQRIKAELEANPLLEEGEDLGEAEDFQLDEPSADDAADSRLDDREPDPEPDARAASGDTGGEDTPSAEVPEPRPEVEREERSRDDEFDWDEFLNNADDLYGYKARVEGGDDDEQREVPMAHTTSMTESLREQLGLLDLAEHEEMIAEQIIGSIDEDGYLRRTVGSILDDIMFNQGLILTEADVERVLHRIQRLDPVGIAARDLQECLVAQLDVLPAGVPGRTNALRMLRDAYKAFTMKHFDQIKRKLDLSDTELKEAFDLIRTLNPKPGEGEFTAQVNYVTPDYTVEFVDDEFRISLNGRNAPELRINRHYRQMWNTLAAAPKPAKGTTGQTEDTKQFLKSRMESARWFINSINQRRQTMLRVMEAIVALQERFFMDGAGHLRPMILKDVAERIGMDISTISRVVNGKYVQTEFGVFELKHFFSEGLATDSGEEVSNKEVKAIIERIIGDEDKVHPLSDQRIAAMLEAQGFQIARRTVTKYREQSGIPVARLRKQIVLS